MNIASMHRSIAMRLGPRGSSVCTLVVASERCHRHSAICRPLSIPPWSAISTSTSNVNIHAQCAIHLVLCPARHSVSPRSATPVLPARVDKRQPRSMTILQCDRNSVQLALFYSAPLCLCVRSCRVSSPALEHLIASGNPTESLGCSSQGASL